MKGLLSAICFLITSNLTAQSPWIPKQKSGFLQVGYSGLYYNQVRIDDVVTKTNRQTTDQTYQLYADYGLSKKVGLMAIIPLKNIQINENNQKQNLIGLSNLTFGLKYLMLDKASKVSIGINYSANSIRQNNELGLRTGYNAQTFQPFVAFGTGTKKCIST